MAFLMLGGCERSKGASQAIPQQDLDNALTRDLEAQAQVRAAESVLKDAQLNQKTQIQLSEAAVEQAQASLTQAELNLSYTTVKAPVDGIIGVLKVDRGNLVGRGEAPLLATMSTVDPFKVAFSVSELDFLIFIEQDRPARSGDVTGGERPASFQLILADGRPYPHKGRPRSLDRALDPRTGTILFEGLFPNPDNTLRAGQFGRVRIAVEERVNATLVPQRAVQGTAGGEDRLCGGRRQQGHPPQRQAERRSLGATHSRPGERRPRCWWRAPRRPSRSSSG